MLKVKQLKISYGGILAVKGIDLEVQSGELVSLIGSNGAGKTSILKAIAGMIASHSGEVVFDEMLSSGKSYELLARGMSLVPEGRGIFTRMTVLENLQMGAYLRNDLFIESDLEKMYVFFPRIKERLGQLAGTLSGGEQQMVAMARALMSKPKLLLLDEPSMGLSPILVDTIFEVIEKISQDGTTILLVEQNAQRALEISDRAYVLASGQISMTGKAEDLMKDPRVSAAYLGT
jgi:branched-chain amino acid transport system ATP-binding protein